MFFKETAKTGFRIETFRNDNLDLCIITPIMKERIKKMITQEFLHKLVVQNDTKIVLMVFDGLGGLPDAKTGKTELESAARPQNDSD